MTEQAKSDIASGWICNRCQVALEFEKVRLRYSRSIFALDLPACPKCGMILIGEEPATGKLAEAKQAREDK